MWHACQETLFSFLLYWISVGAVDGLSERADGRKSYDWSTEGFGFCLFHCLLCFLGNEWITRNGSVLRDVDMD